MYLVFVLTSMAASWLLVHFVVKQRFASLMGQLPDAYQSAIAVPPEDDAVPQLMALCIDLMRKEHSSISFDSLNATERTMVLHAYAVQKLPRWMSIYASLFMSRANRGIVAQLQRVKASRPQKQKQYFGAIRHQHRLRSAPKS